ncbi:uncharacterized protein E6C27_scaffold112G00050 [Cucumis melo var. makuwa]|uniref:Uncharacterized protein n=1 Tax=Cucumis melo var. makuwa TaxID=1194695 RepID=A0A5A7T3P3_CUCMM|nr:uncharacterized protein E6C27_scaffold112G00050 [Cucumis melo var. makuwa]
MKAIEAPKAIEEALFISDFNNPIDLIMINQVLLDEGETPNLLKPEWAFLFSKYSKPGFSSNPFDVLMEKEDGHWIHLMFIRNPITKFQSCQRSTKQPVQKLRKLKSLI